MKLNNRSHVLNPNSVTTCRLLKRGVNLNAADNTKRTALHHLADAQKRSINDSSSADIADMLLRAGANAHLQDCEGVDRGVIQLV